MAQTQGTGSHHKNTTKDSPIFSTLILLWPLVVLDPKCLCPCLSYKPTPLSTTLSPTCEPGLGVDLWMQGAELRTGTGGSLTWVANRYLRHGLHAPSQPSPVCSWQGGKASSPLTNVLPHFYGLLSEHCRTTLSPKGVKVTQMAG